MPQLDFSLEGGPGWKKIRITSDHPYIRCLRDLIKKRVRQDVSTFRVDVDASLFAFKPRNQRTLMRKIAEDVQVKNDRLMLEAKRNPRPKTRRVRWSPTSRRRTSFRALWKTQFACCRLWCTAWSRPLTT